MSLKAHAHRADSKPVHDGDQLLSSLDGVLADLPAGFVVAADGDARLVLGPAGAFVLVPAPPPGADDDVERAARRLHALATRTRASLGEHLAWVPFLDPLLVADGDEVRCTEVAVAPLDLLATVLTSGPAQIDRPTLAAVDRAVRLRHLDRWRAGTGRGHHLGTDGGRIELCDTSNPLRAGSRR